MKQIVVLTQIFILICTVGQVGGQPGSERESGDRANKSGNDVISNAEDGSAVASKVGEGNFVDLDPVRVRFLCNNFTNVANVKDFFEQELVGINIVDPNIYYKIVCGDFEEDIISITFQLPVEYLGVINRIIEIARDPSNPAGTEGLRQILLDVKRDFDGDPDSSDTNLMAYLRILTPQKEDLTDPETTYSRIAYSKLEAFLESLEDPMHQR